MWLSSNSKSSDCEDITCTVSAVVAQTPAAVVEVETSIGALAAVTALTTKTTVASVAVITIVVSMVPHWRH
jgi:hypothetical protein